MARPKNADPEATRARVLAAATTLFAQRGRDGTPVRRIAEAAGVSLATLNLYFGSKNGLYDACIDRMYDDMYEQIGALEPVIRDAVVSGHAPGVIADVAVRAGFRMLRANQTTLRLFMRTVAGAGEMEARYRGRQQRPFLDRVSTLLGAFLGRPPQSVRLPLQTLKGSMTRYALSTDRELKLFAGIADDDDVARAVAAVEDHLVRAGCQLFAIDPP